MSRFQKKTTIEDLNQEARKLGLSYGQYMAYRETGYLEHYKTMQENHKKLMEESNIANKYESYIGAGSGTRIKEGIIQRYS